MMMITTMTVGGEEETCGRGEGSCFNCSAAGERLPQ